MENKKLKKINVTMLVEGIIHVHINEGCDVDLSDAVLAVEEMGKLGGGKKYPVLVDAGAFSSTDKEVRLFSASAESNIYTLADAIAYYNLGQKLLADFYVKHYQPVVPTKVFAKKEEAIQWLKTFKKN
jgi:hypothetical protein